MKDLKIKLPLEVITYKMSLNDLRFVSERRLAYSGYTPFC